MLSKNYKIIINDLLIIAEVHCIMIGSKPFKCILTKSPILNSFVMEKEFLVEGAKVNNT